MIQGVLHIKKSAELENLLKSHVVFVHKEDDQKEIKIKLHHWQDYAIYEFVDATKSGICPIEDLWKFVKAIKK